jgi:endo-1,4-beta-xylanase
MKFFLSIATVVLLLFSACEKDPIDDVAVQDEEANRLKGYQQGTNNGYFWMLWTDDRAGWVNYTNGSGGNYNVEWNYQGNFTCGKGWSNGSASRRLGYNIGVHNHTGGGVIAYYGWTRNPLIEYYVNERWGNSRPTGTKRGSSFSSDGGTYDFYTATRTNAPSIDGTRTFTQYFSTRTSMAPTGSNRTITFANHVNAWRSRGYNMGSDWSPYAIMLTEAYGGNSTGRANLSVWAQ